MKIGITHKLFLAILMASILAVASMVITMQWQLDRGFRNFINAIEQDGISRLATDLESRYAEGKSWAFLSSDKTAWQEAVARSMYVPLRNGKPFVLPGERERKQFHAPPPDSRPPDILFDHDRPPPGPPPHMARLIEQRLFLMNADRQILISGNSVAVDTPATALRSNGQVIGYLGILPRTKVADPFQDRFLQEQNKALVLVSAIVVLLSAGLAMLLASRLIKPVKALANATHCLAAGDHKVRVPVASNDELGRLAEDFNALALTLEKNDQARRQWVADISHELRTPLAILRGEIEAFMDGIRQPTQEAIASLHGEVLRLGRLVEDLYQISLSDLCAMTYSKIDLDCANILLDAIDSFDSEFSARNIRLKADVPLDPHKPVFADSERLHQLFGNLLENSLKYTNPGGELVVRLAYQGDNAVISFEDSAPGVPEEALDRLFDRLYRVEGSRNRALGGAGLGLSICRNIVEAHGGTITAAQSQLGGISIRINLPLSRRNV